MSSTEALRASLRAQGEKAKAMLFDLEEQSCSDDPPPKELRRVHFQLIRVCVVDFMTRALAELEEYQEREIGS